MNTSFKCKFFCSFGIWHLVRWEMAASAFQVLSQPTKTSNKTDSSKIFFAQWNIISSSPGDSRIGVNGEMMIPSLRRSGFIESTNSRQDELNEPNFLPCSRFHQQNSIEISLRENFSNWSYV